MKNKIVYYAAWLVLLLSMTACTLLEEEPLPTLVPVIQLPEANETIIEPTHLPETAVSPQETATPTSFSSNVTVPDNRGAIVYLSGTGEGLYLTQPDGSEQSQFYALQNVDRLLPASFNGQRVGLVREGQLHIARTDGTGILEITAVSNPSWIIWSPTKDEFALIDNGDLVVIQADSGSSLRLTTGMQLADIPGSVGWSPHGGQLLFTCGAQATDLCQIAPDGVGGIVNLTNNGSDSFAWYREPAWSPDGNLISYVSPDENKDLQLFVMAADGSERRQLTSGSGQNSLHSWSPDGQYIAYAHFADGVWQALAIEVVSGDVVELSADLPAMGSVVPQWTKAGDEVSLLYIAESAEDAVALAVVSLAETAVTPITDNGWQIQWSADGRQIAYISSSAQIYIQGISASGAGSPAILDCPNGCESFVWLP